MAKHDWKLELTIKDGHRYFRDLKTNRVAIAGDSGASPDSTEEGVLWLDEESQIRINDRYVEIPLRRPNGDATKTGESFAGALQVADRYGIDIVANNRIFKISFAGLEA